MDFQDSLSDRLFDEKRMYNYVELYAASKNMPQTSKALPFEREDHSGQVRKGKDSVPYIYHPLLDRCSNVSGMAASSSIRCWKRRKENIPSTPIRSF